MLCYILLQDGSYGKSLKKGHLFIEMSLAAKVKLFQLFCAPNITAENKTNRIHFYDDLWFGRRTSAKTFIPDKVNILTAISVFKFCQGLQPSFSFHIR